MCYLRHNARGGLREMGSSGGPSVSGWFLCRIGFHFRCSPKTGHEFKNQFPTLCANNGSPVLFDHLVGGGEQRLWRGESERPGGLQVNHQLELVFRKFLASYATCPRNSGNDGPQQKRGTRENLRFRRE
jgi:hypothetical protein